MAWTDIRTDLGRPAFRRDDGAIVRWDNGPSHLHWIAYEPDPSEKYLIRYSKRGMGWPRRWKSAEAAMQTVDKEYPRTHGQLLRLA